MKKILLGVTGSIAAYKSCDVVRALQKRNLDVKVVMTEHATELVGAATFRALTGHEVARDLFVDPAAPIHHISLSDEPDLFVIAPATANVIAKIAHGVADDLLTTTTLAYQGARRGPLVVAPAMNDAMWHDGTVRENLETLRARGVVIVEPGTGYLACGTEGTGRLAEIDTIVEAIEAELARAGSLSGKHVLITAGPTYEPIDAVRALTNYSSGKMGYALASEALTRGAEVTLVSGQTALRPPEHAQVITVTTAADMYDAMLKAVDSEADSEVKPDLIICAAAVADWRPVTPPATRKRKKTETNTPFTIELEPTQDILAELGTRRAAGTLDATLVGFAAETDDVLKNARTKYDAKHVDYLVVNDVSRSDIGFGSSDNEVTVLTGTDAADDITLSRAPKRVIARRILDIVS
ncbi:MAG: bifunctional phosphopantothenoylcysteine decarboxylase/phosphopantothenate--cysteine ligase CoaBC [Coriobacteriia bacterium]|nr:bifunctional phosphopantothenoylcysteine decarboxylase/phosphopantothenate--cysteine ligase CoaBC [Coriobacteriia bacterium]